MSATSGGGGSVSEGSEAGGSSQSTMSVSDSPSTSFQNNLAENVTKITLSEENTSGGYGIDVTGSRINLSLDERQQKDGIVNVAFDFEEGMNYSGDGAGSAGGVGGGGVGGAVGFGTAGVGISGGMGAGSGVGMTSGAGTGSGIGAAASAGGGIGVGGAAAAGGAAGAGSGGAVGDGVGVGSGAGVGGGGGGGGVGGVEFKLINGSEKKDKVPEAVNLELVNMVPYSNGNGTSYGVPVNGIPMKKDSEQVDMSSPYDEYFVPVNEHKKYMRGEKLYVTKDKRRPTSWRRCLSWIVACTVISVVLIVAILAGTGVILSEPNLVKEASVGRNFAGSNVKPSVTDKSPTPTAEMLMYVPRSIESEFVIDNLKFDPELKDINSTAYQQFATTMEDNLKMLLFDKETLDFGASNVALKVVNISRDPFKVNYRIGWNYKEGANNPPEPIKMEDVKKRLVESLARNQGYIDKYHIDREAIKVNNVVNACQMENGGCSHICYYNYVTQQFTCTCPTHLVLDNTGKNCVAWTGSSEDDALPVPSHTAYPEMPYDSTAKPSQEHDFGARFEHGVHQGIHHHHENQQEPTPEPEPEPTAEPGPIQDVHYAAIPDRAAEVNSEDKYHGHRNSAHGHDDPEAEPTAEPAPEPTAEPNFEGKDHIVSWHDSKDHEPAAEPTPEPSPEPAAEDNSEGRSHNYNEHSVYVHKDREPVAETTPEPSTEDKDHDHADHSVYGSKDHELSAEPTPEPKPEFSSESKDQDHGHVQGHHHSEYGFKDESSSELAPEPTAEESDKDHEEADHSLHESKDYEGTAVPNSAEKTHDTAIHSVYESNDHEPAAEPTPEPAPEPTAEENEKGHEGVHHSIHESKDHEVAAEPNPVGKSQDTTIHTVLENKDDEPAPEPTPEPAAEAGADGKDHGHVNLSLYGSKDHEPAAEPTPEPAAEAGADGKDHGHVNHSLYGSKDHEPAAEPTPEPAAEDGAGGKDHDHVNESLHGSKDHEPAAEPTPEPAAEAGADGADGKDHDINHSLYGSKDHEPAAEPTPEPAAEPTAKPGSDEKDHDHTDHFLYAEKDHEPTPETATERNYKEGKIHGSAVHSIPAQEESVAEPTAEPTPEGGSKDHAVKQESKDHEAAETTPKPGSDFEVSHEHKDYQTGTKSLESASESSDSADGDTIIHFNSGTGFQMVTTIHPIPAHEGMNSNASAVDQHSVPSQGQISGTVTEHPVEGMQTDSDKEKSQFHSPHLEDILIRKPILNSENQEATGHRQNPLDNVELKSNGEPVVEEVIIDKSVNWHGNGSGFALNPMGTGDTDNEMAHPDSKSSMGFAPNNQQQSSNTERETAQYDTATDHPRIVEYSAVDYSNKENKNGGEAQMQDDSKEKSTITDNNQDPSQSTKTFGTERVSASQTNQGTPVTTLHPDLEHEPHTIPVTIEFLHPLEEKREESHTKMPKTGEESPESTMHSENSGVHEEHINSMNDPSKIFPGERLDETKIHKTTTESHAAITTLFPIVKPDESNSQVALGESKENFRQNQGEGAESTKSPEEISNNIKDELLDNEEFNTLIDHEYKNKESSPIDGTKYTSKPIKTEKKKIKDYVKGDKIDQKGEATPKPAVTPAEFILQKHVNGNDNIFDLEYSLQNEHTTKHEGEVTIVDPHGIDVPGVSLKPHGINNHDISILQTVAPDFRTETLISNGAQEQGNVRSDSKNKEGEPKFDKDYSKFDKDYKYEKQKVSKKKDLKKKIGAKDGKNVELEDGRKYFMEITKDDLDLSSEEIPETTKNVFEKVTVEPETGGKIDHEGSTQPGMGMKIIPDGSIQSGMGEKITPDGSTESGMGMKTPPYGSNESGMGEKTAPDGSIQSGMGMKTAPDGSTESGMGEKTAPDGSIQSGMGEKTGPDGSIQSGMGMKTAPDGSIQSGMGEKTGPDGSIQSGMGEKTGPDGSIQSGMGMKTAPDGSIQSGMGEKILPYGSAQPGEVAGVYETRTELTHQMNVEADPEKNEQTKTGLQNNQQTHNAPMDRSGHLMVDEPILKSTSDTSSATVHDGQGQIPGAVNFGQPEIIYEVRNSTATRRVEGVPGTVFDGIPRVSSPGFEINGVVQNSSGQNGSFVIYESTGPKIVTDGSTARGVINSTLIHPTIIVNGQNDNLQDGHNALYGNATFFKPGNATIISILNGTLGHSDGHSFSYFSNGSAVNPTIVVRGQSGTLQGGHEIRFGNVTYRTVMSPETNSKTYKNSNVYRIENGSLPGTVFDGHFNPQEGHYHMFTNSSGLYVYTNASTQPAFVIKGKSGDFGNSKAYVIRNNTSSFSNGFVGPHSVIFRNSTVFAVGDAQGTQGHSVTVQPHELNETIQYTHQMSPSFVSSGTAYKVNDYFGYISKCAAGQFQCLNGTSKRGSACISLSSKCDSINDCSDGSDELGCIENGCPGNFQCSDSTCLKRNLVCNGILDCSDGSDEKNCEGWKCEFDEFQCPSGRCIPVVWQCDSKPDCDNHTDEYNCQTSCGNDEYLCPEGWCIPLTYRCNGIKECSNGEDEQLCDCSHEEFKCQTGGCVSMNQVCNGLEDCPDRSDEWDCVKIEPESNLLKIRSATGNYEPVCADNWTPKYSDEVCASLGYASSLPVENENSSITTDTLSFYVLKNDTTAHFNKKIVVNLRKSDGNCSSGKMVEISCQEFSCGSRSMTDSSSVEARLVGGMSATAGQWPSVALLYNVRNFHSCTANVLTPRWILASYNCLKMGNKNLNEQDWKFFGGSTVFEPEKENPETRKILSIIPNPQVKFNQFLFSNDLALVELDHSLQFTSNLGAVCLPEQDIQPRQICVTAGWGMNTPEDKAIRQQLQYLPVPTMNLTECNSTEHYSGFITNDKICAGYNSPQKSLCYNEEGAPLMCVNDRGEWELQGVLSYHSNCGRGSHPSIFSSITPVSDWIKKTIGNSFERKVLPVTKR